MNAFEIIRHTPDPSETFFRIRVTVDEIESKCVKMPDFQLSLVFWTIQLCNTPDAVNASLVSYYAREGRQWSSKAEAIFRLMPKDDGSREPIEQTISSQFDNKNPSFGIEELVSWSVFMEEYVQENAAIFEVEISTEAPIRVMHTEQISSRSIVVLNNISNFDNQLTSEFWVRGMKWRVYAVKTEENTFGMYLHVDQSDVLKNEIMTVQGNFELQTWGYGSPYQQSFRGDVTKKTNRLGSPKFLSWESFVNANNTFVLNDVAKIIVNFSVSEPKLEKSPFRPNY